MYAIYPFQKYKLTHYCMWDIDWKSRSPNICLLSSTRLSHCKVVIDSMVHNSGPYFTWYVPLSWPLCLFLCFASVRILTPLLPLVWWPWSFHPSSGMCNSCVVLCLYAFQLKGSRDAPSFIHSFKICIRHIHNYTEYNLWAISENWFIIGWSIFSSLVKVKIHLHSSWQIYKTSNRNVRNICLTGYDN